ncbi:cyclic nucleotide-binding domain-containing protein [bacterium]|nr:cyclic nucleotide-binding domain-containing protein [bacterium]
MVTDERVQLLKGLSARQMELIRHCRCYRQFAAGEYVFREGDPAYSIFMVVSGSVAILRRTLKTEVEIARIGEGAVFGEMGILIDTGQRNASARAVDSVTLLEIPNPIELSKQLGDTHAGIKLVENLLCLLAARLRARNRPEAARVKDGIPYIEGYEPDSAKGLAEIEPHLPKGWFGIARNRRKLAALSYLCRQGDASDGFYYIHEGALEAIDESAPQPRRLGHLEAPTIAGEVGYFAGEPRGASLRALTEIEYTHFSGADYEKLKAKNPDDALKIIFAAAQLTVHLILRLSNV